MPLQTQAPFAFAPARWLVQVNHIKNSGKKGSPSYLGGNPLNTKIRLFAAIVNKGREAAAAASMRGGPPFICVTMGDQNLSTEDALNNPLSILDASRIPARPSRNNAQESWREKGGRDAHSETARATPLN